MGQRTFDREAARRRVQRFVRADQVTTAEVEECVELAARRVSAGEASPPIERILVAKGYLEPDQIVRMDDEVEAAGSEPIPVAWLEEADEGGGAEQAVRDGRVVARCPDCFRAYLVTDFVDDNHGCIECGGLLIEVAEAVAPAIETEAAPTGGAGEVDLEVEPDVDFDGYPIRALVGSDELGTTYRVDDIRSGEPLDLKVYHPDRAGDSFLRRDFLKNARRAARLRHPAIQRHFRLGRRGRLFYAVTEPVEGRSLEELLEEDGRLAYEDGLRLVYDLAECLAFAHGHGVVHRNLHPSRVVSDGAGRIRLLGMGLFLPVEESRERRPGGEEPLYMAPEQAREPWLFDPRTDVFSLGCLAFRIFGGEPPYRGETSGDLLAQYLEYGIPRLGRRGVELPRELERLVERMIGVEPESRPQSMAEVLAGLEGLPSPGEFNRRTEAYLAPATEEETAWPREWKDTPDGPGPSARYVRDRQRQEKRKKARRRRGPVLRPWLGRLAFLRAGPAPKLLLVGAFVGVGVWIHFYLGRSFGLETEDRIVIDAGDIEVAGPPFDAGGLSAEERQSLTDLRLAIEEAMADGRTSIALTQCDRALSIRKDANRYSGDLWFLRGLASFQHARLGRDLTKAEIPFYLGHARESMQQALATYRRPGARTRYDVSRPGWFPFRQGAEFEGDLGYVYTQAEQSLALIGRLERER